MTGSVRDWLDRYGKRFLSRELEERIQRLPKVTNEYGYDPFGFDPETAKYAAAVAAWIYRSYFRAEAHGVQNIPPGRVLLVANHSGQIPIDAMMIACAVLLEAEPPRFLRSMIEKWAPTLPFLGTLFSRCGQVVGTPENCRWLLSREEAILVFPEGARGISKTFDKRYQLQEFGLGFMRLALETRTPVVPVAVIGAEEQLISVYNVRPLAKLLGMPAFPIALPGVPLPTKYHLHFGDPMQFEGGPNDEDSVVEAKVKYVRNILQELVQRGLETREHVFW